MTEAVTVVGTSVLVFVPFGQLVMCHIGRYPVSPEAAADGWRSIRTLAGHLENLCKSRFRVGANLELNTPRARRVLLSVCIKNQPRRGQSDRRHQATQPV